MISKTHLSTILLFAAIIWGVLLIVSGVTVSISWLRYLLTVAGILSFLLGTFDKWLWRLPFLRGWFVKRPIIGGTWRAVLRSNWIDPSTGNVLEPIEGFMVIRQTYSSLSLRLLTSESSSELIGAEIVILSDGTIRLVGIYRNEPNQLIRQRSPIHYGAILLQVMGQPVTNLVGHYWTDRNTAGEIELNNHRKKIYNDFETAKHGFNLKNANKASPVNKTEQENSQKVKIDLRTILFTIAFMLFIFLLVTLLIPKNNIIGIILQTLAGLIFIIDQIWQKIIQRDYLEKLSMLLSKPSFQQRLPLLAIPVTTAVALITYYKISGTDMKWSDVFLSMTMAAASANFFYLVLLIYVPKWYQRFIRRRVKTVDDTQLNRPLWSNWILFAISTIVLILGVFALFPLSKLSLGHSTLATLPFALYLTIMAVVTYGWVLSIVYFFLYGLFKLVYALSRFRVKIGDADKIFVRQMTWTFLVIFWLWGGILLILDMAK